MARLLGQDEQADENEDGKYSRRQRTAECEATGTHGLIQQIPERGAKRPGENECRPK